MADTIERSDIHGHCDPKFQAVADAFAENFAARNEAGASVCVSVEGETVVDLWGGVADPETGAAWERDTICPVFSCTKAATALCAQLLIDRGELDLYAPIARYWPEFAQAGKEETIVLMALNHTLGLPALRAPVPDGGFNDWDYVVGRLAAEEPFWEPGTRNGYHMITFGWLVGELVRRVSGKSLGAFFRDEIAGPLGLDFWIGLPEAEEERFVPIILFRPGPDTRPNAFSAKLVTEPDSIQYLSWMNTGGFNVNKRESRAAEIGGGGGVANARGLAGMYVPLANDGRVNGRELISKSRIDAMRQVSVATMCDANLLLPTRFGQGFMLTMDNRWQPPHEENSAILGAGAFGHVGAGGSIGFADPERRLAMGYAMTRMGGGLLLNERGQALVDAVYPALGCTGTDSGFWA